MRGGASTPHQRENRQLASAFSTLAHKFFGKTRISVISQSLLLHRFARPCESLFGEQAKGTKEGACGTYSNPKACRWRSTQHSLVQERRMVSHSGVSRRLLLCSNPRLDQSWRLILSCSTRVGWFFAAWTSDYHVSWARRSIVHASLSVISTSGFLPRTARIYCGHNEESTGYFWFSLHVYVYVWD